MSIKDTELIINPDGSAYHLGLLPEDVAQTVITVGDPERVSKVAVHLDSIDKEVHNREFHSIIGRLGGKQILIISTGIGTDNIDIVLNEIDALVNVDFVTRQVKDQLTSLNIIRIGTSGAIRDDIPLDTLVLSHGAIGLDGLMHFYQRSISAEEDNLMNLPIDWPIKPYFAQGSEKLLRQFDAIGQRGITLTNTGFYGPQARQVRSIPKFKHLFDDLAQFSIQNVPFTNMEMETAGIYGIGGLLGHHCISINAIVANRITGHFSVQPDVTIKDCIRSVFEKI